MERGLGVFGYKLVQVLLIAADIGLPQDRVRAWFATIREDVASDTFTLNTSVDLVDSMKLASHLPFSRFVLAPMNPYLLAVVARRSFMTKKQAERRAKLPTARPRPKKHAGG